MGGLDKAISFMERNRLSSCAFKELLGANIPHVFLVTSPAEGVEQAIGQFGSSAVQTPLTLLVEHVIDHTVGKLPLKGPDGTVASNEVWLAGKTAALYTVSGGGLLSIPLIRNVVSMSRTGRTDFVGVTGLNGPTSPEDPAQVQKVITQNKQALKTTVLATVGLSAGIAVGSALLARRWCALPKALMGLLNQHEVLLPQGRYSNLTDKGAVLAWALPAYTGVWIRSRDKVEKQEVAVRAAGWGFAFTVFPKMLEKAVLKQVEGKSFGALGAGKNVAFLAQLGLSIGLYTLIPSFVTLVSRKGRAQQAGLLDNAALASPGLLSHSPPQPPSPPSLIRTSTTFSAVSVAPNSPSLSPSFQPDPVLPIIPPPEAPPILIGTDSTGWRIPAMSV